MSQLYRSEVRDDLPSEIPESFTLKRNGSYIAMGLVLIVVFGGVMLLQGVQASGQEALQNFATAALCIVAGIIVLLASINQRIDVAGEHITIRDMFGKTTELNVGEITGLRADFIGSPKLLGENGRVFGRFDRSMKNFAVMLSYLRKHNIHL